MSLIVDFPSHRPDAAARIDPLHAFDFDRRAAGSPRGAGQRVSFDEETEIKLVQSLVRDHKSDIWSSSDEMAYFKASLAYEVGVLRRSLGGNCTAEALLKLEQDNEAFTMMGLENFLSASACLEVEFRRRQTKRAVMAEQERQRLSRICDPDLLANASEVASYVSRKRAGIVGLLHDRDRK